jgi:regulator of sirC expression with transglutaminase-like and TPR domain
MNLDHALPLLFRQPDAPLDVAELALHLARDEYPNLDVEAHLSELNAMAHEARRLVRGGFDAAVAGLARYLFHDLGFRGNSRDYYDPRNSYFNQVLERRTGIPITLSAVAMAVGRRTGLNVVGVGLPGHFIVKVSDGEREILLDPFHGGRRLVLDDCAALVFQATGREFDPQPAHLQPIALGQMVLRMLNNLKGIYLGQEDFVRAGRVLERLNQLAPSEPLLRRDLGVCYLRLERPGKALDHLAAYLHAAPNADDHVAVAELHKQAQRLIAGLN